MPKSLNRAMLIGNLGKDPEVKFTPQGTPVAKVSIATNERFKDKAGEWQDRTEWHTVIFWQRLAEIAGEYLKKGSKIFVEGRLQTRSWDDQQHAGVKHYSTEIVAADLVMLDGKPDHEEKPAAAAAGKSKANGRGKGRAPIIPAGQQSEIPGGPITDEDIPF